MAIFLLKPDCSNFQGLHTRSFSGLDFMIDNFNGLPIKNKWKEFKVVPLIENKRDKRLPKSDYPVFGATPVFSQRAVDALGEILTCNGELLPLCSNEGKYFAYNITNIVPALNVKKSKIEWLSKGQILDIEKYSFLTKLAEANLIFKIPESLRSMHFVSSRFVSEVNRNDLKGFLFEQLSAK